MQLTSLGLRTDLMVRRLARCQIYDRAGWTVVRTSTNPGFYWGNFIIAPSRLGPGGADEWQAAFVEAFPGARHRAFAVDGTDGDIGDPSALAALGVRVDVSTVLTVAASHGLAESPPPERGVECRVLAVDRDWEQLLALREATYGRPDTAAERVFRQRRVAEARALVDAGHGVWAGAFDDGSLAAALGIVSDGSGLARYQNVETHPDHRRRGLARRLLHLAADYAADELGADLLVIVADPEYHAIDLYRSIGFTDRELQVQYEASS